MQIIDLETGGCVDWLRIDGAIGELYDVAVIPGIACAMALTPGSPEAASLVARAPMAGRARGASQAQAFDAAALHSSLGDMCPNFNEERAKDSAASLPGVRTRGVVVHGLFAARLCRLHRRGRDLACSGALTTTQTLNAASLTVTTNSGFGINTAAGDAMDLTATGGGLTFTNSVGSSIAGANIGINANNYGSAALSITTTGTVTGTNGTGVYARNYGTDLTIQAAAVTSGGAGIRAYNFGTGALSITSTGTVGATTGKGVYAKSYGTGGLTIQTAAVTGGTAGIDARIPNGGGGALSITSTGTVTATTGIGVYARTYGTGLTIQTGAVTGATEGIDGRNISAGALSITSTGMVTGKPVTAFTLRATEQI